MKTLSLLLTVLCHESFVAEFKDKRIELAFDDGDIHTLLIKTNRLGISTGTYLGNEGEVFYENMTISSVVAEDEGCEVEFYKDRSSPAGTFRYPVVVRVPPTPESGSSRAKVDLRWGRFETARVFY